MILAIIRGGWKSAGNERREGAIPGRGEKRARRGEKVYANEKKKKR